MCIRASAHTGQAPTAVEQVEDVLRRRRGLRSHQDSDFDLSTADKFIEQFDRITAAIGLVTIAISAVGLMVGGIGVMNIMLVSVTERIKEIGVRKALGARRRDIQSQFIVESVLLTGVGGILGVVAASLFSFVVGMVMSGFVGDEFSAPVQLWAVAIAVVLGGVPTTRTRPSAPAPAFSALPAGAAISGVAAPTPAGAQAPLRGLWAHRRRHLLHSYQPRRATPGEHRGGR